MKVCICRFLFWSNSQVDQKKMHSNPTKIKRVSNWCVWKIHEMRSEPSTNRRGILGKVMKLLEGSWRWSSFIVFLFLFCYYHCHEKKKKILERKWEIVRERDMKGRHSMQFRGIDRNKGMLESTIRVAHGYVGKHPNMLIKL